MDYYNAEMIEEENHKLSPSGKYYVPSDGQRQDYIDFIEQNIPLNDLTEVFGLHDNADITSAINATDTILSAALSLQPRATSSGGKTQDAQTRPFQANDRSPEATSAKAGQLVSSGAAAAQRGIIGS